MTGYEANKELARLEAIERTRALTWQEQMLQDECVEALLEDEEMIWGAISEHTAGWNPGGRKSPIVCG